MLNCFTILVLIAKLLLLKTGLGNGKIGREKESGHALANVTFWIVDVYPLIHANDVDNIWCLISQSLFFIVCE